MFDANEGLFGLFRYENTPLEITEKDGFGKIILKGAAHGAIDGVIVVGATFIVVGNMLRILGKNQK